ncbi:MAG: tetratricopeptide repeat protein [Deltaproteobacteria bacterium]|nr:tetratricopeptide repeat protein [Deltaproteobacteria bacterium]
MSEFTRTLALAAVVALAVGAVSSAARAQEEQRVDEEARGLFLAGRAAFSDGRWQEALEHFQHAYELSARPGLLYNIGQTADRMREDEVAVDAFERFLQASPDAPNRGAVESRLAVLRHAIAERQTADARAEAEAASVESSRASSLPPILVLSTGALAAATGAVLLVLAKVVAGDVNAADEGTPWVDVQADYRSSGTLSVAGGVFLGLGAAVAGAGLLWLLLRDGGSGGESVELSLSPTGAAIRGRF